MSSVTPLPTLIESRRHQLFPRLSDAEVERMRRFGAVRRYADRTTLFEAGKTGPGMFVVRSGRVAVTRRDARGENVLVVEQGPGEFLAEVGQLSGRPALVDGTAIGDVETLLIPPEGLRALLVAEAELGERIMSYREQALKLYPWICGRCAREFTHRNLRELTVHHRDHNHDHNPPELLCLYCHDNEHQRQLEAGGGGSGASDRGPGATHSPFADLKALLANKPAPKRSR